MSNFIASLNWSIAHHLIQNGCAAAAPIVALSELIVQAAATGVVTAFVAKMIGVDAAVVTLIDVAAIVAQHYSLGAPFYQITASAVDLG